MLQLNTLVRFIHSHSPARLSKFKKILARRPKSVPTPDLVALCKKFFLCVTLLRRLVGPGWGASATTLCTAALFLVYSTAEYCTPVWCCSTHTHLLDSVLNDTLCIVTGCLHATPMDYLFILLDIQPVELC